MNESNKTGTKNRKVFGMLITFNTCAVGFPGNFIDLDFPSELSLVFKIDFYGLLVSNKRMPSGFRGHSSGLGIEHVTCGIEYPVESEKNNNNRVSSTAR